MEHTKRTKNLLIWFNEKMWEKLEPKCDQDFDFPFDSMTFFLRRLKEELRELEDALINRKSSDDVILECADIANFAMFMANYYRKKHDP